MVISLELGADLHMVQLMPLTVSCFSKIQIGFAFVVPAHLGSPGQRAVERVCVCVCGRSNKYPMGFEHVCKPSLDWLVGAFWREIVGLKASGASREQKCAENPNK